MKLLVMSDLHLEHDPLTLPRDVDCDAVILAGDIHTPGVRGIQWARSDQGFGPEMPVVLVPGNHEFYRGTMELELAKMREVAANTNVHVLDGDELIFAGVRILGCTLWTDFRLRIDVHAFPADPGGRVQRVSDMRLAMGRVEKGLNDYYRITTQCDGPEVRVLRTADTLRIHRRQRNWLRRKLAEPFAGKTVVVTHHAPHRASLDARYASDWLSPGFVSELPDAFFEVPALWIHGHTHTAFDYRVGNCRVVSNPRGYVRWSGQNENPMFDPALVVEN